MNVKMYKLAWESDLVSEQKYILLALVYLAEEDGYTVYGPISRIAIQTNMSERNIQRKLGMLEQLGWVEVAEEASHHLPRVYKIKNPTETVNGGL
jgi:DNA-binding HxlR family transcriptional regulator